ncbi:NAD(P)-binding protein [Biscogniauxia marginata]|nr:NAD(P)-binding protein [Biscogniauxia marginata]
MAQFRLDGFAIIVGAAGGIGREVVLTFAEAGVKGILLADINSEAVGQVADQSKALASNPKYRSISTTVDVADVVSVDAMANLAKEQFDRIDYCVNAFGGVFLVTRAVAKIMKSQEPVSIGLRRHGPRDVGRGAIVNVSSAMALIAVPAKVSYTTSKHAVIGVTKAAAMDYKSAGIRINQVCSIWVKTPMFEEECRRIPQTPHIIKKLSSLKRAIEPDEVASACLYLCSPTTIYLNGITSAMDSGLTAGPMFG